MSNEDPFWTLIDICRRVMYDAHVQQKFGSSAGNTLVYAGSTYLHNNDYDVITAFMKGEIFPPRKNCCDERHTNDVWPCPNICETCKHPRLVHDENGCRYCSYDEEHLAPNRVPVVHEYIPRN